MLERLSKERRNAALAVLALLVLVFAWSVRDVLNPLLLAYLLAFMAHPAVLNLERRGWSRLGAVNMIYALLFAGTVVLGFGLWAQGNDLARRMSRAEAGAPGGFINNLDRRFEDFIEERKDQAWIAWLFDEEGSEEEGNEVREADDGEGEVSSAGDSLASIGAEEDAESSSAQAGTGTAETPEESATGPGGSALGAAAGEEESSYFVAFLQRIWQEALPATEDGSPGQAALRGAGSMVGFLRHWFGSLMGVVGVLFLLPIYTWYLLFELEGIHAFVRRYVPDREKERVTRIGSQIGEVIAGFFRGRLLVCLLKGLLLAAGLWAVGLPYALFLGLFAGFLSLIPFVGALFGFVFAFLVLLVEVPDVLSLLLKTGLVFGIVEGIEGYVLVPKILGDQLGLHPLVVFVSVFVGGSALGMFGFLVALPLTAALVILCRELVLPALAEFADEPEDDPPGPDAPDDSDDEDVQVQPA